MTFEMEQWHMGRVPFEFEAGLLHASALEAGGAGTSDLTPVPTLKIAFKQVARPYRRLASDVVKRTNATLQAAHADSDEITVAGRLLWLAWSRGKPKFESMPHGDLSLVKVPRIIHTETGRVYRLRPELSPRGLARPALSPRWILDQPTTVRPRPVVTTTPQVDPTPARRGLEKPMLCAVGRQDDLDAIADKTVVALLWGLHRTTGRPVPTRWVNCDDFNREDAHPSTIPSRGRALLVDRRAVNLLDRHESGPRLSRQLAPLPREYGDLQLSGHLPSREPSNSLAYRRG